MFGERNSVLAQGRGRDRRGRLERAGPRPRPDRAWSVPLDRGAVRAQEPAELRIFVLHHHLLPVPGTGRERNVVYDAGDAIECLQRAGVRLVLSGHKHVPYVWRLEDLFVVNAGTVSSLRLRGNTRPCYNVIEIAGPPGRNLAAASLPRPGEARLVLARHARVREVHRRRSRTRSRRAREGARRSSTASTTRPSSATRSPSCRTRSSAPCSSAARRSCAAARSTASRSLPTRGGDRRALGPSVVVDLSDEPVLGPVERFCAREPRARAAALPYVGADFRLDPPVFEPFAVPSLAVVGTGKRVGKTAVTGHLARLLSHTNRASSSSRWAGVGRREPEVDHRAADGRCPRRALAQRASRGVGPPRDGGADGRRDGRLPALRRRSRGGGRQLERRGGRAVAAALGPDLVDLRRKRRRAAARSPTDRRVVVVGGHQDPRVAAGYLNKYRLLLADLVVVTMAEDGSGVRSASGTPSVVSCGPESEVVATRAAPRAARPTSAGERVAYLRDRSDPTRTRHRGTSRRGARSERRPCLREPRRPRCARGTSSTRRRRRRLRRRAQGGSDRRRRRARARVGASRSCSPRTTSSRSPAKPDLDETTAGAWHGMTV